MFLLFLQIIRIYVYRWIDFLKYLQQVQFPLKQYIKKDREMIQVVSAKKKQVDITNCTLCKHEFIPTSPKYYCCQINEVVCKKCRNKICNTCKQQRTKLSNIKCMTCNIYYSNENQTYYYFKTDSYQCIKCLAPAYIFYYQQAIRHNLDPKTFRIDHNKNEDNYLEELIVFFKNWCLCCKKGFNDNAFQMKLGVRICSGCLEVNFDKLSNRLISCIQCNGYMKDRKEIYFEFSGTEVYCIYCANLQKERMGSIRKKEEVLSSRLSNNYARSQIKGQKIIPAVHLSSIRSSKEEDKHSQQSNRLIKAISKLSIEQQSINKQLVVEKLSKEFKCCLCLSNIQKSFLLTLTKEDIEKIEYKQQFRIQGQNLEACLICILQLSQKINKENRQHRPQLVKQKINEEYIIVKKQQEKILSKIKSKQRLEESQIQHNNPVCMKCRCRFGQVKSQKGFICLQCHMK